MRFKISAWFMTFLLLVLLNGSIAQESWNWANPLPQGNVLNAIACNDTLLVTVGSNGTILASSDGDSWKIKRSNTRADLYDIVWTGTMFVAAGDSGTILISMNGESWEKSSLVDSICFLGVAQLKTKTIAVGTYGTIAISTDGQQWSLICPDSDVHYCCIAASDSVAVALEYNGKVARSTDGISWTFDHNFGNFSLSDIIWTGNSFVALGMCCYQSSDGINWSGKGCPPNGHAIAYSGSQYVSTGNFGETSISSDLMTWSASTCSVDVNLYDITFWNGLWFAVGTAGVILVSSDGTNWARYGSGTTYFMYDILWTGSQWVAVGHNILTSDDGSTWLKRNSAAYVYLRAIANAGTKLVAVGLDGCAYYSQDGTAWTTGNVGSLQNMFSATAWNNQVIAGGNAGTIAVMTEAGGWTVRTVSNDETFWDIAASPSVIVAAGWNAYARSTNASEWMLYPWPDQVVVESIEWSGKEFIAVGVGGAVLLSEDGSSWQQYDAGCNEDLMDVCWTGNEYVAVGENGIIVYSKNGRDWSTVNNLITDRTLWGVKSNSDITIAVGRDGAILQAKSNLNVHRRLRLNGRTASSGSKAIKCNALTFQSRKRTNAIGDAVNRRVFDINGRRTCITKASAKARVLIVK